MAAATLAVCLPLLASDDLIPVRAGLGFDGRYYAGWVVGLSLGALLDADERPPEVVVTTYSVRRVLLPMTLHYLLRALDVEPSPANVVRSFRFTNALLLVLAVLGLGLCADRLGLGPRARWLAWIALLVNYVDAKMPFFYPVLTDTAALAAGTAMLLAYLSRRTSALFVTTLAGGFVWPSLPYFGALLLAFPLAREEGAALAPAPGRLDRLAAGVAAVLGVGCAGGLVASGYDLEHTSVKPMVALLPLSLAFVGGYLYLGLRPLLDSRRVWLDLEPARLVRSSRVWLAVGVLALGEAIVRAIPRAPDDMTGLRAVGDTFVSAVTEPGIAWVAHALHYGPLVLLLPFLWRPVSENVRRCGTGLVGCFVLAILLGTGSESRKLLNFYPAIVLWLVQSAEPVLASRARFAAVALLSLLFSKVWLTMGAPAVLPGVGEVSWRFLYASSRGPWIDHGAWAVQGVLIAATAIGLGSLCRRPLSRASPAGP